MTLPIEIWKHCIIPYLVDDTSNCKNAVAVAGLRPEVASKVRSANARKLLRID